MGKDDGVGKITGPPSGGVAEGIPSFPNAEEGIIELVDRVGESTDPGEGPPGGADDGVIELTDVVPAASRTGGEIRLTEAEVEKAVAKVVSEMVAGKMDRLVAEAIERAVADEIERLKGLLLGEGRG